MVAVGSIMAVGGLVMTVINTRHLRRATRPAPMVTERVSVLLPMRNEATRAGACVNGVLSQIGVPDLEVIVLDDGSVDDTVEVVRKTFALTPRDNARVTSSPNVAPPAGWLGKTWASARLADDASGSVLVFVDADVVLAPDAIACAVAMLRQYNVDVISPYPRQLADGSLPRLIQPLLQWSWFTTVPLRISETSRRESLAVANGQFLVIDRGAYDRSGGFAAVRGEVLDDVALLRAVKASGGCGTVVDGTDLATCRMYESGSELIDGYTKSLWSAFGSPVGAVFAMGVLSWAFVLPPVAALCAPSRRTRLMGLSGYCAAVAGRLLVGRVTGARLLPDALAHPASIVCLAALTTLSWQRKQRGVLQWKGRSIEVQPTLTLDDSGGNEWRG